MQLTPGRTTTVASSLKRTQLTAPAWPRSLRSGWPVATSQTQTCLSAPPEATRALSLELCADREDREDASESRPVPVPC